MQCCAAGNTQCTPNTPGELRLHLGHSIERDDHSLIADHIPSLECLLVESRTWPASSQDGKAETRLYWDLEQTWLNGRQLHREVFLLLKMNSGCTEPRVRRLIEFHREEIAS
jgi:hypothetical protein